MTRDEIISMAREAGLAEWQADMGFALLPPGAERFAALVAAKEREACAAACEAMHEEDRPGDYAYAIRARSQQ